MSAARRHSFEALSLASFVALGLPDGMIGTAWPAIRRSFDTPVGDLGLVLLAATGGTALLSLFAGRLFRQFGVPILLVLAACSSAVGAIGIASAPGLWLVLVVVSLIGAGSGLVDSGLNAAFSLDGRQRLLNLLHGAYSVGTAIGPLLVTVTILAGSWRIAYIVLGVCEVGLAGGWLAQARRLREGGLVTTSTHSASADSSRPTRYRLILILGIITFFLYTGLEVAAGQWEASYGRGHLHLSPTGAGVATFSYWAAIMLARLVLALPRRPVRSTTVVTTGCLGALLATGLIWSDLSNPVSILGFVLLGVALGGVFPALVSLTPGRVGFADAHDVVAWQIGAAVIGGSGTSAVIGLLIEIGGFSVLGPSLVAIALLLAVSNFTLARVGS